MTKKITTLLFDFDYTLADSSSAVVKCANHALVGLGFEPASPYKIRRTIGLSIPDTFVALVGKQQRHKETEFRSLWRQLSDQIMVNETFMLPDVVNALRMLHRKGFKLGIASTKFRPRIEAILLRESIGELFDAIVGGNEVTRQKPYPDILHKALKHLNRSPDESLYIGDSRTDALAASRAKISFIAVLSGVTTAYEFMFLHI